MELIFLEKNNNFLSFKRKNNNNNYNLKSKQQNFLQVSNYFLI